MRSLKDLALSYEHAKLKTGIFDMYFKYMLPVEGTPVDGISMSTTPARDMTLVHIPNIGLDILHCLYPGLIRKSGLMPQHFGINCYSALLRYNGLWTHFGISLDDENLCTLTLVQANGASGIAKLRRALNEQFDYAQRNMVYNFRNRSIVSNARRMALPITKTGQCHNTEVSTLLYGDTPLTLVVIRDYEFSFNQQQRELITPVFALLDSDKLKRYLDNTESYDTSDAYEYAAGAIHGRYAYFTNAQRGMDGVGALVSVFTNPCTGMVACEFLIGPGVACHAFMGNVMPIISE